MNEIFILDKASGQLIEKSTMSEPAPYQFSDVNVFEEHYRAWQQHVATRRKIHCVASLFLRYNDKDELRMGVDFFLTPGKYGEHGVGVILTDAGDHGSAIAVAVPAEKRPTEKQVFTLNELIQAWDAGQQYGADAWVSHDRGLSTDVPTKREFFLSRYKIDIGDQETNTVQKR